MNVTFCVRQAAKSISLLVLALNICVGSASGQENKVSSANQSSEDTGLLSGPMVGYGEITEVMLWVQTTRPAAVQFRFWSDSLPGFSALSDPVQTSKENDCIAQVRLSHLEPGARYSYELYLDGRLISRPYRLSFQTQPLWQWRTDPPNFTVAIGSCAYINETEYDRPGKPYGGDFEIFRAIAAKQPDVMLWLGDNVYYREVEFYSAAQMRHRYRHDRALPEWQALLGATHHYAIWDDHDYGPNDSDWTYRMKEESLRIFKSYWANPSYGLAETPGIFFSFLWDDIEFFMLDDRYHRSPNDAPASPEKVMFGAAQIRWLKEALIASHAPFKVIAGGSQMLNPVVVGEAFGQFEHEQRELLQWIKGNRINGIFFLSGDKHHTELIRRQEENFYPLYDYTCSPLTSGTHKASEDASNPARVSGTFVTGKRNFGMLRFDGPRQDRRVTMECYDKDGKQLWQHVVKASELRVSERRSE